MAPMPIRTVIPYQPTLRRGHYLHNLYVENCEVAAAVEYKIVYPVNYVNREVREYCDSDSDSK